MGGGYADKYDVMKDDNDMRPNTATNRVTDMIISVIKPFMDNQLRADEAHEKLDQERFKTTDNNMLILRRDLLDEDYGILVRIQKQTETHTTQISRLERILWVLSGALAVLAFSGNSVLFHLIAGI